MKRYKTAFTVILLMIVVSMYGCYEIDIVLNDDNSCKMTSVTRLGKANHAGIQKHIMEYQSEVSRVTKSAIKEEGEHVYLKVETEVSDISKFKLFGHFATLKELDENTREFKIFFNPYRGSGEIKKPQKPERKAKPEQTEQPGSSKPTDVAQKKTSDGEAETAIRIERKGEQPAKTNQERIQTSVEANIDKKTIERLANTQITIRVTFPGKIISTNGTADEKNPSLISWHIPFKEFYNREYPPPYAKYSLKEKE